VTLGGPPRTPITYIPGRRLKCDTTGVVRPVRTKDEGLRMKGRDSRSISKEWITVNKKYIKKGGALLSMKKEEELAIVGKVMDFRKMLETQVQEMHRLPMVVAVRGHLKDAQKVVDRQYQYLELRSRLDRELVIGKGEDEHQDGQTTTYNIR
jgi:hypothetical protein